MRQIRKIHHLLEESPQPKGMTIMREIYQFGVACQSGLGTTSPPTIQPGIVQRAKNLIQAELERGINVNEVVRILGVSRTNLFQRFKAEVGRTPIQYLTCKRLERATELLQDDAKYPVAQVARMSGFRNHKYFMRVFHKEQGCTPSAWRGAARHG